MGGKPDGRLGVGRLADYEHLHGPVLGHGGRPRDLVLPVEFWSPLIPTQVPVEDRRSNFRDPDFGTQLGHGLPTEGGANEGA